MLLYKERPTNPVVLHFWEYVFSFVASFILILYKHLIRYDYLSCLLLHVARAAVTLLLNVSVLNLGTIIVCKATLYVPNPC